MKGLAITGLLVALFGVLAVPAYADPPSITAPPDIEVEAKWFFTSVDLGEATVSTDPGLTYETISIGPSKFQVGSTTVTWLVTDSAGGRAIDTQTVTILDTTPPTCPDLEVLEYSTKPGKKVAAVFDLPIIPDSADLHVDVTASPESGSKFPIGDHMITFTATDDSGNSIDCTQDVRVVPAGIENLVLTSTHNSITATWDLFDDRRSYVLTLANTEGEIEQSSKVQGNSETFSDLDPDTVYEVRVSVTRDETITAAASATTASPPFTVTENFANSNGWTYDSRELRPNSFNNYSFAIDHEIGDLPPSAKISGNGNHTAAFIQKEFDLGNAYREGLYVSVNHKSGSDTDAYGLMKVTTDQDEVQYVASLWMKLERWKLHSDEISMSVGDGNIITVELILHDYNDVEGGYIAHFDNFMMSTVQPDPTPETFQGGTADRSDLTPEQREFDRVLYGIVDGTIDPLEYMDGTKTLGQYDELLKDVLMSLGITSS